jgi:glycosyltransferase involved in cell wall biosynthesis
LANSISQYEKATPPKLALILWADSSFGGAERRFVRLAFHLAEQQLLKVTIFCFKDALKSIDALGLRHDLVDFEFLDIQSSFFSQRKLSKVLSLLALPAKIQKGKFDRVFYATNPDVVTYFLTRLSPVLPPISIAMVDLTYEQNATGLNRFVSRKTINKVLSVDCLSPAVKEAYSSAFDPEDSGKIKLAPCSFTDFSKVKETNERDIDIVILGRFTKYKGHELLEQISAELSEYNLHICGSGPLNINVPDAKIYSSSDPFDILSRAKISLSLQQFGNYPSQVVLESMASGCVVVATDVGETRLFLDESCSMLIGYNSAELLSAVKTLLNDDSLRQQLSEQAKVKVYSEQTIERYSDYFLHRVLGMNLVNSLRD